MSSCLYLRFLDSDCQQLSWLPVDTTGPTRDPMQGTPEEAAPYAGSRRIILLAPAADILLTEASPPTQNRQRLLQAIPFALENQIADDIELQHFTIGRQHEDNSVPVAIVSKLKITNWLNKLEAAGIRPHAIYPETLCLPRDESGWTLLADEKTTLLRSGDFSGLTLDTGNAQQILELLLAQADESQPGRLQLIYTSDKAKDQFDETRIAYLIEDFTPDQCDENPLLMMAKNCHPKENLNLLHGPYLQDDHSRVILRSWYPAFAVGLLLVILGMISALHEQHTLSKQHQALSQQIEQLFKKSLPESKKMVNPRVQMSQKLKQLQSKGGDESGFLRLVNLSGKAIKNQQQTTLNGLSYRQGQLDIQLNIQDLQMLDQLKQQLEKSQLAVEIRSANAQKDRVKAHLQIKGAL